MREYAAVAKLDPWTGTKAAAKIKTTGSDQRAARFKREVVSPTI
jgi:hypothetical protein